MELRSTAILNVGVVLSAFLLIGLGAADAQTTDCQKGPFLVLNLAGDDEIANKAIAFNEDTESLRPLLEATNPAFLESFRSALKAGKGNTRWITDKGQAIAIYIIYDPSKQKKPNLEVTEKSRKTRFSTDLETLTKLAQAITGRNFFEAERAQPTITVISQCRILTNIRSTLEATATSEPLSLRGSNETKTPEQIKATSTVTTGPKEHAFLSADLAINKIKELKLESGTLVPKDNPSQFYVGFDYMLGDVLSEDNSFIDGLTFKALAEASKDPTNSWGVGIGMRLKKLGFLGISIDTLSPFVGYVWNRNDSKTGHSYKGDWRAGISLNLDKALGWVQGNAQ